MWLNLNYRLHAQSMCVPSPHTHIDAKDSDRPGRVRKSEYQMKNKIKRIHRVRTKANQCVIHTQRKRQKSSKIDSHTHTNSGNGTTHRKWWGKREKEIKSTKRANEDDRKKKKQQLTHHTWQSEENEEEVEEGKTRNKHLRNIDGQFIAICAYNISFELGDQSPRKQANYL